MAEGAGDPALALPALLRPARADTALRRRLRAAPADVLREHGIPANASGKLRRFMAALTTGGALRRPTPRPAPSWPATTDRARPR